MQDLVLSSWQPEADTISSSPHFPDSKAHALNHHVTLFSVMSEQSGPVQEAGGWPK